MQVSHQLSFKDMAKAYKGLKKQKHSKHRSGNQSQGVNMQNLQQLTSYQSVRTAQ